MLSTTVQHALRSLTWLAALAPGEAMLGRELAERAEVPANYLGKILLILKRGGIVDATRGTGGGYALSRPAEEIRLVEVVELFDRPSAHPGCFLGIGPCSETDPCEAHRRWRRVKEAYEGFLENTTLAQISRSVCAPGGASGGGAPHAEEA